MEHHRNDEILEEAKFEPIVTGKDKVGMIREHVDKNGKRNRQSSWRNEDGCEELQRTTKVDMEGHCQMISRSRNGPLTERSGRRSTHIPHIMVWYACIPVTTPNCGRGSF